MNARWFPLVIVLAAASLLLAASAAAAPPFKVPPRGTPGVAAAQGMPGTITFTQYAPDGVTVLDVIRAPATGSDTSASVAARLGKIAPVPGKPGDPGPPPGRGDGRPDAESPAASPASASTSAASAGRTTAAVKRVKRIANCCSPSGCGELVVTRDITSDVFGSWLGTFHHRVYWCWNYPRITGINVSCWSHVDGSFIDDHGCGGWGNYYFWRGDGHGGHVSFRQADWGNCLFFIGCIKNIYPWIQIWVNGNGAWAQDQGG